jgi:hypothetical protein
MMKWPTAICPKIHFEKLATEDDMAYTIHKVGKLRGDKIRYKDGVGHCVWYPLSTDKEEEMTGICFDFPGEDIEDFIKLLQILQNATPDEYQDDED